MSKFLFVISGKEKIWLRQLANSAGKSQAEILRILIQIAAQRAGLPDPDKQPSQPIPVSDISAPA